MAMGGLDGGGIGLILDSWQRRRDKEVLSWRFWRREKAIWGCLRTDRREVVSAGDRMKVDGGGEKKKRKVLRRKEEEQQWIIFFY
jgi:hypothetical protein